MKNQKNKPTNRLIIQTYSVMILLLIIAGCNNLTDAEQAEELQSQIMLSETATFSNAQARVDVCHVNGKGEYNKITVADAAFETHVAHGDGAVGDPVPGMDGYIFGEDCQSVGGCPCFSASLIAEWDINLVSHTNSFDGLTWSSLVYGQNLSNIASAGYDGNNYSCSLDWEVENNISQSAAEACRNILLEYEEVGTW